MQTTSIQVFRKGAVLVVVNIAVFGVTVTFIFLEDMSSNKRVDSRGGRGVVTPPKIFIFLAQNIENYTSPR